MASYILTESMVNTVALYMVLKKMMTPFTEWAAYDLGIIDKDGKKLKDPVTSKELEAWDLLTKFVWNFKKILIKVVGKSKMAQYFSMAYLLKENLSVFYIEHNKQKLNETLLSDMTYTKQNFIFEVLKELPPVDCKITEENFEYYMNLYVPKVEKLLENKIDYERFLC